MILMLEKISIFEFSLAINSQNTTKKQGYGLNGRAV